MNINNLIQSNFSKTVNYNISEIEAAAKKAKREKEQYQLVVRNANDQ